MADSGTNLSMDGEAVKTVKIGVSGGSKLGEDAGSYCEGATGPGSKNQSGSGFSTSSLRLGDNNMR